MKKLILKHPHLVLAGSLLIFLCLAGWRLDARWLRGDEGYAGAQHHAIARHQLAHGLLRTNFAQMRIFHDLPGTELFDTRGRLAGHEIRKQYGDRFWTSRLPFGAALHTLSLAIFGDHEWAVRLIPYTAAAFLIAALALLLRGAYGSGAAVLVAASFALNPGTILHARLAGYEIPCLLLSTITLILWDRYRNGLLPAGADQEAPPFWPVWCAALFAGLSGWFGLFAPVLMFAESFRRGSPVRVPWRARIALVAIPLITVLLYLLYVHSLGQSFADQVAYFWTRRSLGAATHFSLLEWIHTVQKYFFNHITPLPIILGVGWIVLRLRKRGEPFAETRLIALFAAFAGLIYLSAAGSAYEHRYYTLWWLPFFACAGGFFLARIAGLPIAQGPQEETRETPASPASHLLLPLILAALFGSSLYKIMRHHEKTGDEAAWIAIASEAHKATRSGDRICILPKRISNPAAPRAFVDEAAPFTFYLWRRITPDPILSASSGAPTLRFASTTTTADNIIDAYIATEGNRVYFPAGDAVQRLTLGLYDGDAFWMLIPKGAGPRGD